MPSADAPPTQRSLPLKPKAPGSLRIFTIVFWICVAIIAALVIQEIIVTRATVFMDSFWIVSRGFLAVALLVTWHAARKLLVRRFLALHAGFVCPGCHYPMRGLPSSGTCPECGVEYSRASVLSLWEQSFKLGTRYPRHAQSTQPLIHEPIVPVEPPKATPPWIGVSLRAALDQVTAIANAKGFVGKGYGAYSLDIDQNTWRVQRAIPTDLHAFYLWFDPDLWNAFVSARTGDTETTRDTIAIRPPSLFRTRTPTGELIQEPPEPTVDSPPLVPSREPMLVDFADSCSGHTFAYCLGTDVPPHGAICLIGGKHQTPVLVAQSLASWLARLAVCNGAEPHIDTTTLDLAPAEWRESLRQEIMS